MAMTVERLTVPAGVPFVPSDVHTHIRASHPILHEEAQRLAMAAATELEHYAHIALLTQRIRVTFDRLPELIQIGLPIGPVLSGDSVTVTCGGEAFTDWRIVTGLRPALVLTGHPHEWRDAVWDSEAVIEYDAGFGTAAAAIPPDLAAAVMDQACLMFDSRGGFDMRQHTTSPHMTRIAARYRRVGV